MKLKGKVILKVSQMDGDHDLWLEMRNKGIGGSEVASIVGLNPWKSAYELWLEKTGRIEVADLSNNESVEWGIKLEELVAEKFCEVTGKKVRRQGMIQDEDVPYFFANIDRALIGDETAGLECKTTNAYSKNEWKDDQVPAHYICQCQWYMGITGATHWWIAVLIGGNHFVYKKIERNEEDIKALRDAAKDFWYKVQNDIMPEVDDSSTCSEALDERYKGVPGTETELPSEAGELINNYFELQATKKELGKQETFIKNKLKSLLGDNEVGRYNDYKVTWKEQAGRVSLDTKMLESEHPDIYAKYLRIGNPTRTMRIK